MQQNPVLANFTQTYKPETGKTYKYNALLRHKGVVIAFAMDSDRRIRYTVQSLADDPADTANTAPKSPFDKDAWLHPEELNFPAEISEVGFGVAGNTLLPVFKKDIHTAEAAGTVFNAAFDAFRSTTARLSADAQFQVLSDGQYIYLFRQALGAEDKNMVWTDRKGHLITSKDGSKLNMEYTEGGKAVKVYTPSLALVKPANGDPVPIVQSTLLVDRFVLVGNKLTPKLEIRFQRSRSKTRPANRKDSLGPRDLDGNFFYEPTQELKFVANLTGGRFSVLLLPTAVAGLQRWQIFAENSVTHRMDAFNLERSAEGLFNLRGTPETKAEEKGYAESALQFTAADARIDLMNGPQLKSNFTIEAWIKPAVFEGDASPLLLIGTAGNAVLAGRQPAAAPSIWIEEGAKLRIGFGDGDSVWYQHISKGILVPGDWNHIAVSFDGAALRIFHNGRLRESTKTASLVLQGVLQKNPDGTEKKAVFAENARLKLSERQSIGTIGQTQHSFCGIIDEIRVWARARNQDEISAEQNHRLTGLEPDLKAYWHFDEQDSSDAVINMVGLEGAGALKNCVRVKSDAPVGEHPGLQRSSFVLSGRTFAGGPAALLYYQQNEAATGYAGKKKPLKKSGRVMFTVNTKTAADLRIAALDFGVSAKGRLAQMPDVINLTDLNVTSASNASLNANLDEVAALQAEFTVLDRDVVRLEPILKRLNDALPADAMAEPVIGTDFEDNALTALSLQLKTLRSTWEELQRAKADQILLDKELAASTVTVSRTLAPAKSQTFANITVGLGSQPLSDDVKGFVSTLAINGPVSVRLQDADGLSSRSFDGSDEHISETPLVFKPLAFTIADTDNHSRKALSIQIEEMETHRSRRDVVRQRQDKLKGLRAEISKVRDSIESELNAKTSRRDFVSFQLREKKNLLNSGASALMHFIAVDQFGLSVSGGLLGFAWTKENSTPSLFDSATGSLAMYFRGTDDQYFVAYYDTRTEPARYALESLNGAQALRCTARTTEEGMDKIEISISDTSGDPDTCQVVLKGPDKLTETWLRVPRNAAAFAAVLNGTGAEHSLIGTGALNAAGTVLFFDSTGNGVKRALAAGATIAVGDTRFVVQTAVDIGAKQVQLSISDPRQPVSTDSLAVFFIGYDYQSNAVTTHILADLYNGSLLLGFETRDGAATASIKNQTVSNGVSISSLWTADAPGTTLLFDGKAQHALMNAADSVNRIAALSPEGDFTMETWVRPTGVSKQTRLLQHCFDSKAYAMGLEKTPLMTALKFDGVKDFIDLGIKNTLVLGNTFTQEAWIFPEANDDGLHGFLGGDNPGDLKSRAPSVWIVEKTRIQVGYSDGAVFHGFLTDSILTPGAWNHIAVTFDGAIYQIYVNGIQKHIFFVPAGKMPVSSPFRFIGKADNFFPGMLDEVRIWSRVRTDSEITADMNRRLGGMETGLIGYWHFGGGVATDYSRNKNNGIITGKPAPAESPIAGYTVFGAVNNHAFRSAQIFPAGTWNHLALVYRQAYGLRFNGTDSGIDCGKDVTLELNQDLTIEVSLRIREGGRNQLIVQKSNVATLKDKEPKEKVPYSLFLTAKNMLVFAFENVADQVIYCAASEPLAEGFHKISVTRCRLSKTDDLKSGETNPPKTNEWFEIAMYVDGKSVDCQLFINGEESGAAGPQVKYMSEQPESDRSRKPVDIGNSTDNLVVGKSVEVPNISLQDENDTFKGIKTVQPFSGAICEIRIWNTARDRKPAADGKSFSLDSSPIGAPLQGNEKGLVSWWRFREGKGNRVFDSKSQNHGLISGAEWVNSPDPLGSTYALYINGLQHKAVAVTTGIPDKKPIQFTIGALQKTNGTFENHFQGELEEMRIWKVARTAEQIQDNLFRSLVERKNAGSSEIIVEEQENLLAYYTFDADAMNPGTLGDQSLLGNDLSLADTMPDFLFSGAPVSGDIPLVRSALAGMKNAFNGLIGSAPAVQEYADMQSDSAGNLIGVLKRCYGFIDPDGQWQLLTGYKVGDMATEWIGQVQFAPELIGFIEGAPPVPSENLTTRSVDSIGDDDDYNQSSVVELVQAEEVNYTYSANRDTGFDTSVEFLIAFATNLELNAGFGVTTNTLKFESATGLSAAFELSLGWLQDASTSVGRTTGNNTSMELRGRFSSPKETEQHKDLGIRFVPDNVGQALVRSETADVFALRLVRNGALISFQMKPNPDIPKDWNIISFPINPNYTKQGTLDGKVGLEADVDYPNALTYSPDSSYFKPIEAYALKNKINRAETELKTYFEQFSADTLGRAASGKWDSDRLLDQLPQLHKRNIVNTYVWTAEGGLFAETMETMDSMEETIGGSYEFKGMAGLSHEFTGTVGVGMKFELNALFGGHLNLTVNKTTDSKSSFGLNVNVDKVERDVYERQTNEAGEQVIVLDTTDPKRLKPVKKEGKVDAYRFMSFFLEPDSDHHEQFFNKIVDPVWLKQSDEPAAVALRSAQQPAKKPPCWRVMHRVTYVSRVLPSLSPDAPPSLEKTLQTLDIDSNYELIKLLEPYVVDKRSSFSEFSAAVEGTVTRLMPELIPHLSDVKQFLNSYFNTAGTEDDTFGKDDLLHQRVPNLAPIVNAGPDMVVGLDINPKEIELDATVIDDRISETENLFLTWEKIAGPDLAKKLEGPFSVKNNVSFAEKGFYEFRLTAGDGFLTASDSLFVTVNKAPEISAGPPLESRELSVKLVGTILDNGLGNPEKDKDTEKIQWKPKAGVTFTPSPDAPNDPKVRMATFANPGHYLLEFEVRNDSFTVVSEVIVAVGGRVTRDVQALFTFDEKDGNQIHDVSGMDPALDLKIHNLQKVTWGDKFLQLNAATAFTTQITPVRLHEALRSAGQLSVELWITPEFSSLEGQGRLLTLSDGGAVRNLTLAQNGSAFVFRVRTSTTDLNATNKALLGGTTVAGRLTHVVVTRNVDGLVLIYVDGKEEASRMVAGDFSNWSNDLPLALGNEPASAVLPERAWRGKFHLAAVYSRALSAEEVQQNFNFGADKNLPPVISLAPELKINWDGYDWNTPILPQREIDLPGRITHDRGETGAKEWKAIGGLATTDSIADKNAATTKFTARQKGRYAFRLSAGDGTLNTSAETVVTVNCQPNVVIDPAVLTQFLVRDAVAGAVSETTLSAETKNAGLGNGADAVTYKWTPQQDQAADLEILDPDKKATVVRFKKRGFYTLQLEVSNGELSFFADFKIAVNEKPVLNINALPVVTWPVKTLEVTGIETDSGLGDTSKKLKYTWEVASGPKDGLQNFAPADALKTTATFKKTGLYVLQLTATHPDIPGLFATAKIRATINQAPVVDLGSAPAPLLLVKDPNAQPPVLFVTTLIEATVSDDGLPETPGALTLKWTRVSGPENGVTFFPEDTNTDSIRPSFTEKGKYVLQIEAGDGILPNGTRVPGSGTATQQTTVVVNTPPLVNAGAVQKVTAAAAVTLKLNGVLEDSGLGDPASSPPTFKWEQISGPGSATISVNNVLQPNVTIPKGKGIYVFQVTANNGFATDVKTTRVVVNDPAVIEAGFETVITPLRTRRLKVRVLSDGLGDPQQDKLTFVWSIKSGNTDGVRPTSDPASPNDTSIILMNSLRPGPYTFLVTVINGATLGTPVTAEVSLTVA